MPTYKKTDHDQTYTLKYVRNFHLQFILILTVRDDCYLRLSFYLFQKLYVFIQFNSTLQVFSMYTLAKYF